MGKTQCKKKEYTEPDHPKYMCKRCERLSKKEDQVCKPHKLK